MSDGPAKTTSEEADQRHLEVAVADAADCRFVPHLTIIAEMSNDDGETVGPVELPYLWHPGLHHYGANLTVPGDGSYDVRVQVEPATFGRHDEKNGDRYADPVEVVFEDVDVKCGQA